MNHAKMLRTRSFHRTIVATVKVMNWFVFHINVGLRLIDLASCSSNFQVSVHQAASCLLWHTWILVTFLFDYSRDL